MIIANPLYDVAFNRLMENERIVRFFLSTILNCDVLLVTPLPPREKTIDIYGGIPKLLEETEVKEKKYIYRKDFSAVIKLKIELTEEERTDMLEREKERKKKRIKKKELRKEAGIIRSKEEVEKEKEEEADIMEKELIRQRKVIIELHKVKKNEEIDTYHNYNLKLPIISIYILGFNLTVEQPIFITRPACFDMIKSEEMEIKDDFVKQLFHTSYIIQTLRILPSNETMLEKLLTLFEQFTFTDDTQKTKEIVYPEEEKVDSELQYLLDELIFVAADQKMRDELDREHWEVSTRDARFINTIRDLAEYKINFAKQAEHIEEQADQIVKQTTQIQNQSVVIENQAQELEKELKIKYELARILKKRNVDIKDIADLTNIPFEEIKNMKI